MRAAHRAKWAALALGVLAVPAALVVTVAEPAAASAPCGKTGPLNDDGANIPMTSGVSANMRSGSSTGCGVKGWTDNRDLMMYYCYTRAGDGQTWTFLWNITDDTTGWVKDSLLPYNGSDDYCGF